MTTNEGQLVRQEKLQLLQKQVLIDPDHLQNHPRSSKTNAVSGIRMRCIGCSDEGE